MIRMVLNHSTGRNGNILVTLTEKLKSVNSSIIPDKSGLPCLLDKIHPSPLVQGYRNTDDFSIWPSADGKSKTVGFVMGKIGKDSSIPDCLTPDNFNIVKNSHKILAREFQHYRKNSILLQSPAAPPPPLLPPAKIPVPMIEKSRFGGTIERQEMPTRLINELYAPSVYDFRVNIRPEIEDPRKIDEMKCIARKDKYESIPVVNYANTIMHIRRRKIKKHHRRKWIKNNLSAIKYTNLRRNIQKEKLFRAEIFAAVKEAENFDPEKYVDGFLKAIDSAPKPVLKEENLRKTIALMRKYRAETDLITPEFDDPVKPVHENVFKIK